MSTSFTSLHCKVIRVPKNGPRFSDLVTKFRDTRLKALQTDPTAFASQYATEAALPLHVWTQRLTRETTILICVAEAARDDVLNDGLDDGIGEEARLLEGQWVGYAAVRGPMSYEDYYVSHAMGLPVPEKPEGDARWHVYDLYTLPEHRGRGLAKMLVDACLETAVECTRALALETARVRLFMNPKNTWLAKMYEGFGFRGVGKVTMSEAFAANALDESVPQDTESSEELRAFWHSRHGLAMEQVVGVL